MKSYNKIVCLSVLVVLTFSLLTGCSSSIIENSTTYIKDNIPSQPVSDEIKEQADLGITKMEKTAEDSAQILYVNMNTAELCVEDKKTGEKYFSNPIGWKKDQKAADTYKNILGSQVVVSYYGPDNTLESMNSYADSFLLGQLHVNKIENGVKVVYQIGTASSKRNFPMAIRKSEFEKILKKVPKEKQSIVKSAYRLIDYKTASQDTKKEIELLYPQGEKYEAIDVLRPNLGVQVQDNLENLISATGYSYSDIEAEYQTLGYTDKSKLKASFVIPVEYRLENGNFTAKIISEEFKYVKGFSLTKIDLLPFFGATGKDKTGSMIVPDGSGAVIKLNKDTSSGFLYSQPIYGKDIALLQKATAMYSNQVYMPVFGIVTDKSGMLAVVEEGESAGTVSATVAGVYSSYNQIYSSFSPMASDYLKYDLSTDQGSTYVFPLKISKQPYKVRYILISKPNPTYVDAAITYRDYLLKIKILKEKTNLKNMPLNIEFLGAIDKRETFFGVPYNKKAVLTSYEDAQRILFGLLSKGIGELNVRYSGWANEGINNSAFSNIKPINELGGTSGLKKFNEFLVKNNIRFYPDVELSYVYKSPAFSSFSPDKDAARSINRQVVNITSTNLSTGAANQKNPLSKYVLSPLKADEYLSNCLNSFEKLGLKGVSFASLGTTVSADYNEKKLIDRALSFNMLKESFQNRVADKYNVMLDGCNAALLKYTDVLLNMPMESSGFSVEDESIPFYQIAVHGYIPYAGEPVNMAADYTNNLLKSIETGASLYCKWMAADNNALIGTNRYDMYSLSADTWFSKTVSLYESYNASVSKVINAAIVEHKKLSGNVFMTSFDNGYSIIVNYNNLRVVTPYGEVNPKNYILTDGREQK